MRVKTVALNEKGNLKPAVRKAIVEHVCAHPEVFMEAKKADDKNVFVLEVLDADNNAIYVNFDVSVSTLPATDRAVRKAKAKAPANDPVEVE